MYNTVDGTKEYISFYSTYNVNFLEEKSRLLLARIFLKLLLFKSASESVKVTQVYPAALETVVSQPIAVDSDLDAMNAWCGARTLPLPPEKKIKCHSGTQHMAVQCLSQGCLFGGSLALQFGRNLRKKRQKQPAVFAQSWGSQWGS